MSATVAMFLCVIVIGILGDIRIRRRMREIKEREDQRVEVRAKNIEAYYKALAAYGREPTIAEIIEVRDHHYGTDQ